MGTIGKSGGYYLDEEHTQCSRNPDMFKAIMLTSAGLSGGISSAIAGGNFWAGVRQGIITAGLNHLGNHVEEALQKRYNFTDAQLKKMYYDQYAKVLGSILHQKTFMKV